MLPVEQIRQKLWSVPVFPAAIYMDFLISDPIGYRELRQMLTSAQGMAAITRTGAMPYIVQRENRADQYGIRTQLVIDDEPIKFEIVREARITLAAPGPTDNLCAVKCSIHPCQTSLGSRC